MSRISPPELWRPAVLAGTVTHVDIWSETHVSGYSTGGGGYLHEGTGVINQGSMNIRSAVRNRQRIFYVDSAGAERSIEFSHAVPFMVGHGITIVSNANSDELVEVVNSSTNARWVSSGYQEMASRAPWAAIIIGLVVALVVAAIFAAIWVLSIGYLAREGSFPKSVPPWLPGVTLLVMVPLIFVIVLTACIRAGISHRNRSLARWNNGVRRFWDTVASKVNDQVGAG